MAPDREAGECATYCRLRSNPTNKEYSILGCDLPARPQVHTKRLMGCTLNSQARMVMCALTQIASFLETRITSPSCMPRPPQRAHRPRLHEHAASADGVVSNSDRSMQWRTLVEGAGNIDQ
jgi:hypothetical protein